MTDPNATLSTRTLVDPLDRGALRDFFAVASDYIYLEKGRFATDQDIDEFFASAPPNIDPSTCVKLGIVDQQGAVHGIADLSFGYPNAGSAYIGLLMLSPALRGRGWGRRMFEILLQSAIARQADEMFIAVLDQNPTGRAFWESCGFVVERPNQKLSSGSVVNTVHRMRLDLKQAMSQNP